MAKSLDELDAFNLAHQFKLEVYRLLREHPEARKELKFWSQLRDAARGVERNVAEGWRRYRHPDMAQFLRFAVSSNEEGLVAVQDGVDCEYWTKAECARALEFGRRGGAAIMALIHSLDCQPPYPQSPKSKHQRRSKRRP